MVVTKTISINMIGYQSEVQYRSFRQRVSDLAPMRAPILMPARYRGSSRQQGRS